MNNLAGKGSMSAATSGVGWKTADVVPDQFPAGLRVLVVDDDPTCLMIMEKMLRTCYYEATKCNRAELALSLLRENRHGYDIVISDVHMPDMDGFKLLEHIGLEMDLPVIMMSADDGKQVVMKGVTHGACDYLVKPVGIEALRNIWQHVIRKKKDSDYSSSANEASWRSSKRKKDEDEEGVDMDDASNLKKLGVVWTVELHQQFIRAVDQLGIDKAVPKRILELMNVPGLTRGSVASHLQKYRLYLRQLSVTSSSRTNNSTTTGQRPAQSPATPQASGLGRPAAKARMPLLPVVVDQRNLSSFENHKMRVGDSGKQTNLFHGVPTNMVYKEICLFCLMLLLILVMLSISYF